MKALKILAAIALTEIIIAIPVVTGIYAWGMLAFAPDEAASESTETECTVAGTFTTDFTSIRGETYYQFKSYDNEVWWALTESEIGFVPNFDADYALTYDNNGTTKANKPCDCEPWIDCECELYDDEFISVTELVSIADKE